MNPGTNRKKPKRGEQNCPKLKLRQSDIALFSIDKNAGIDMVTRCLHFGTTNLNFSDASPKKCQFLD
jgi:hypothetical protein